MGITMFLSQAAYCSCIWLSLGCKWPRLRWRNGLKFQGAVFEPVVSESEHKEGKELPYRALIVSATYRSTHSRSDIRFSLGLLSMFVKILTTGNWVDSKRVVLYVQGTREMESQLVPLHQDQGCKMAIFQGCKRKATLNGQGISRPATHPGLQDSGARGTGRLLFI